MGDPASPPACAGSLVAATEADIRRTWPHLALALAPYVSALSRLPPRDPEAVIAWSRQLMNALFLPAAGADWLVGLTVVEARTPSIEVLLLTTARGPDVERAFLAAVAYAFDRMGGHRVEWRPVRDEASAALARRAGMREEAVFPDALIDRTACADLVLYGALRREDEAARS